MSDAGASRTHSRSLVVLTTVLLALAAFGATTQTWITVALPQSAVQTPPINVAGSDAATSVTAFGLVALAAALAVSIAGRMGRWIIAGVLLAAGVGMAWASIAILRDPAGAAAVAVGKAVGVPDGAGATIMVTGFPVVPAVAGVLLMVAAMWMLVVGRTWSSTRRYSASAPQGKAPQGGGTQSDGTLNASEAGDAGTQDAAHQDEAGTRDEIDSWDLLSRGQDPTR